MEQRIFAIGDIHGCYDQFREMLELKINLTKYDILVLLGDYIDRGPDSKAVIDYILDLQARKFNLIPLRGNHEVMLLDAFKNKNSLTIWLYNGAEETIRSFGLSKINEIDESYVSFFRDLKYYYSLDNYLFVHAGFNDHISDPFQDVHHMIWTCRETYRNPKFMNKTIIHGHNPRPASVLKNQLKSNKQVIGIDTGCVYKGSPGYGKLTAIELNSMQLYSV